MEKNKSSVSFLTEPLIIKYLLVMKIALLLILTTSLQAFAINSSGQDLITINLKDKPIASVLKAIQAKYDYRFGYSDSVAMNTTRTNVQARNETIDNVMQQVLAHTSFSYKKINPRLVVIMGRQRLRSDFLVTGVVTDVNNTPLPGVSVFEKGTNNGTSTDANGRFRLTVTNGDAVLVITYVGYMPREIPVSNQADLTIPLVNEVKVAGEEVVIVGYGTQKKINQTGGIATIEPKNFTQSPVANISNSMVGRVPGLFAMQSSGEPGNDTSKIYIRGIGTYTGNTNPLVLVDGLEVPNYNAIDPNEIASVSILKDASSTAVYEIRGANGVIIITTKRGKIGKPRISYTFNQGLNSFTELRTPISSADFAKGYNYAQIGEQYVGANYAPLKFSPTDIALYENGADPLFHPNTDWMKVMFKKTSLQSMHNINLSGGQKKVSYFVSAGFFNQSGLFNDFSNAVPDFDPQSTYRRYNLRTNFDFEILKGLKLALDLASVNEFWTGPNSLNGTTNRTIGDIMKAAPIGSPGIWENKVVYVSQWPTQINPVAQYLYTDNNGGVKKSYKNNLNGSFRVNYDLSFLTQGLALRGSIAARTFNTQNITNYKIGIFYTAYKLDDGTVNFVPNNTDAEFGFATTEDFNRTITAEGGVEYNRKFKKHTIGALALYNQQKNYFKTIAFGIPSGYQSYIGRVTYDYDSRYLAEFNTGYNGSENFAPGKRFGFFPAYSLGWIISNENFFPKNDLLTFLKLSGSYGKVGNDKIGGDRFLYRPTTYIGSSPYYFGNYTTNYKASTGYIEGLSGNPFVTWEVALKRNLRLEFRMLNDKLSFVGDLWDENRDNILDIPQTFTSTLGIRQPPTNFGKMLNRGYEAMLSYADQKGKFSYRISANYSFARNKVIFKDEIPPLYPYLSSTGISVNLNQVYIADGFFNSWSEVNDASRPYYVQSSNKVQPGDMKFRDVNGDGMIDQNDRVWMGYPRIPEKNIGLSAALGYGGFDMSFLLQAAANVSYLYSQYQSRLGYSGTPLTGAPSYMVESWTPERYAQGLPIQFQRYAINGPMNLQNSLYLADASYLRLKNCELGYSLKSAFLEKAKIRTLRMFANANNLFTWSKLLPGIDPETRDLGANIEPYPITRTINFGLNVNF